MRLALEAARSVQGCVDGIYALDGPYADQVGARHRSERTPGADLLRALGVTLGLGTTWPHEGVKRTALLELARRDHLEGWALWLDSDERLRNGERLREILTDLRPSSLVYPILFVDPAKGFAVRAPWKLTRYDHSTRIAARCYFFRHQGRTYDLSHVAGRERERVAAWTITAEGGGPYLAHHVLARPAGRRYAGTAREAHEPMPADAVSEIPFFG